MWLVLSAPDDAAARWAYGGLKERGLDCLEWITSEDLAVARWEHRVATGQAEVTLTLDDGRTVRHDQTQGVLNRLLRPATACLDRIHPSDRDYVMQELNGFYMSWLYALPEPVLNRPTSEGLCGKRRSFPEWLWLAMRAGLPTPGLRLSGHSPAPGATLADRVTVFVVGRFVVGAPAPSTIADGCRRLAELARCPLLGVEFSVSTEGGWRFADASVVPDLRLAGPAMLDALACSLTDPLARPS